MKDQEHIMQLFHKILRFAFLIKNFSHKKITQMVKKTIPFQW